jgi:uncharacterized protein
MNKLLEPLNDAELDSLDRFLLERIDEDADDDDDSDPGLVSVSGLDGLFTALISGPVLATPEQWMPVVWGDYEPEWEDEEHFEDTVALMMRHMNTIAATLEEAPAEFEPLFLQDDEDGETFVIVDDWCEGYVRAVALAPDEWSAGGAEVEDLLHPLLAFSSVTEWAGHELDSEAEIEKLSQAIPPNVRALYAFWKKRRAPGSASPWDKSRQH